MKSFGTLSFGHYGPLGGGHQLSAQDSLLQAIDLAQGMDELGANGIYFRVHHFARQQSSPMPLLAAIAARTERIEIGTGVIDMRYENPLYLAEEAAAVDLISGGRLALGVSRGSPETVVRGYEAFGYTGSEDPRGADIAREHFSLFLRAIEGEGLAERDPYSPFGGGTGLQRIEPHSPGLRSRIWWGAGNRDSAGHLGDRRIEALLRNVDSDDLPAFGCNTGSHRASDSRTGSGHDDRLAIESAGRDALDPRGRHRGSGRLVLVILAIVVSCRRSGHRVHW